jgi:PAS domain S-box-containing protein
MHKNRFLGPFMTSDWFESIAAIRDIKVIVIVLSLSFAFSVILLGLLKDILIITPLLFYIPIIVTAYWYPKKAILFAITISAINIILVYFYSYPGIRDLTYTTATASFYVLVSIALIISSLTRNLKAQEMRYHGVFDYSEIGILLAEAKNDDHIVLEVNRKVLSILGFTSDTIIGKPLSLVVPEPISRHLLMDQIQMDGQPGIAECILSSKDGTTIPVLISGSRMPDDIVILNIMDIGDRKKSEEQLQRSLKEKEILLREVHHRVKNNMQVISGLIELQSAQITDPETHRLFQESYERIKTMALIHESLYRSDDFARIDFSLYLEKLISSLLSSYGRTRDEISVDIRLRVIQMNMDIAVPCGLIANELISNSLKHGFPNKRHGIISIRLVNVGEKDYEFTVSDDGIGFPQELDFRNTASFGLQLINGLATHQMRGTVELHRGNGTTFVIRFPCQP